MYPDPDAIQINAPENKELDRLLSRLDDCDLGGWDRDFVDSMIQRFCRNGGVYRPTARQEEQLIRLKERYNV